LNLTGTNFGPPRNSSLSAWFCRQFDRFKAGQQFFEKIDISMRARLLTQADVGRSQPDLFGGRVDAKLKWLV